MLRSSNPILSKKDAFTPAAPQYGQSQFGRSPYQQYPPEAYQQAPAPQVPQARMSFDDVVTKTAVTIGTLAITAAIAWLLVPTALYLPAMVLSGLVGFVVVMVVSFRRNVSPGLVLAYAAIEGIFIGILFSIFDSNSGFLTIVTTALFGVVFGIVWALVGYAATRGQRDFSSVKVVVATRYEVLVEHKFLAKAQELLAQLPGGRPNPFA